MNPLWLIIIIPASMILGFILIWMILCYYAENDFKLKLFKNKYGQEWWRTEMPLASSRAKRIGLKRIAELIRKQRNESRKHILP